SDTILGFKIAHYWTTQPYDSIHTPWANVDAVMKAGRAADLPVMFDWYPRVASGGYPARTYRELILEKSRPGDIHTHCFARHIPVLTENGEVNPDIFKAQERGFIFDLGHGAGSFVYRNAVPAIKQGYIPDSFGTDMHRGNVNGPVINMSFVISKMLNIGVPLAEVIRRSTVNPARIMRRPELGTLTEGRVADIAIFDVQKGSYCYLDTSGGKFCGDRIVRPLLTMAGGKVVFDPTGLTYPIWEKIPKDDDYWVNPSGQFF
ncbi:MAG: amidohydrolase family protein, partial [Candidatus Latescibacteria bacterium]|nr:amidohydrolase family protein [Candidatus Latescibacterota bacterium]